MNRIQFTLNGKLHVQQITKNIAPEPLVGPFWSSYTKVQNESHKETCELRQYGDRGTGNLCQHIVIVIQYLQFCVFCLCQQSCEIINDLPNSRKCAFIERTEDCHRNDQFIDYTHFVLCRTVTDHNLEFYLRIFAMVCIALECVRAVNKQSWIRMIYCRLSFACACFTCWERPPINCKWFLALENHLLSHITHTLLWHLKFLN